MRMLIVAALSTAAALAQAAPPLRLHVDLDRPGALETVKRERPDHFGKIVQIRDLASRMPCLTEEFGRTLQVKFEVREAACGALLMTSYPSKRRLSFTLGESSYVTVVEMDESENRLVPAK